MKTKEPADYPVKLSEIKKVSVKAHASIPDLLKCYSCESNPISPYETGLCDFCADEIRFRVLIL